MKIKQPAHIRFVSVTVVATFCVLALLPALTVHAMDSFVASSDNPVLFTGVPGSWDSQSAVVPNIVIEDGTWYMFYFGQTSLTGASAIGFAVSDNGIDWTEAACNPILTGDGEGFDAISVSTPIVQVTGDTWQMYYTGIMQPVFPPDGLQGGYASAPEPCGPWTRLETPVLTNGGPGSWDSDAASPDAIVQTDDGYVMYYTGSSNFLLGPAQIGVASSSDGITWTKYDDPATMVAPFAESDPVLQPGPPGSWDASTAWFADVVRTGAAWEMYYSGADSGFNYAIGYATSSDGITWVKLLDNPVFTKQDDPQAPQLGLIEAPHVVDTQRARLLYYDYGRSPGGSIGFAISDGDEDGVADTADNCPLVANVDQRDTDIDGIGNRCDADLNNDCVINAVDLGLFKSVFFGSDEDADFNGDGEVNPVDLGILKMQFFAAPGPGLPGNICE